MKFSLVYRLIVTVLAILVGTAAAGGGVALAASNSVPGDPLYTVKCTIEDARLALTSDPAIQAQLCLGFATNRAQEMAQLADRGREMPEDALRRMSRHTERAMHQIAQASQDQVPGLLAKVVEQTRVQLQVMEEAHGTVAKASQLALRQAQQTAEQAYQTAKAAQGDPSQYQSEYQNRYQRGPEPIQPTEQERRKEREQTQAPDPVPTMTPKQHQEQNGDQGTQVSPTPKQHQEQNGDQGTQASPTPQQSQEQEREQNQVHTPTPAGQPKPGGGS